MLDFVSSDDGLLFQHLDGVALQGHLVSTQVHLEELQGWERRRGRRREMRWGDEEVEEVGEDVGDEAGEGQEGE